MLSIMKNKTINAFEQEICFCHNNNYNIRHLDGVPLIKKIQIDPLL